MKRLLRWLGRGLLLCVILALLYNAAVLTMVIWWKTHNPGMTSFMRLRLAERSASEINTPLRQTWVPYEQIAGTLKRAVVAAEDDKFVDHDGFDWDGIEKAWAKNHRKGLPVAGGSTISQQLAKNLFLSPSRSFLRKGEEALITVMIENLWDKTRILEVYLNIVEWGDGIFGCEAAAQHYYQKSAAQLNAQQAARLAVMLPNPRKYEKNYPPRLAMHAERVQRRMESSEIPDGKE